MPGLVMIKRDEICSLIPHAGAMCLLDTVKSWDEKSIICMSRSHQNIDNPLRNSDGLPMLSLLEYGAQAMAVHACLLSKKEGVMMKEGYLVALRDIQIAQGWLSDVDDDIEIGAERIYVDVGNMIYTMTVQVRNKMLISGRATVVAKFRDSVSVI